MWINNQSIFVLWGYKNLCILFVSYCLHKTKSSPKPHVSQSCSGYDELDFNCPVFVCDFLSNRIQSSLYPVLTSSLTKLNLWSPQMTSYVCCVPGERMSVLFCLFVHSQMTLISFEAPTALSVLYGTKENTSFLKFLLNLLFPSTFVDNWVTLKYWCVILGRAYL